MANAAERSGLSEHQDGPGEVDPQPVEVDSTEPGPSADEALGQRDPACISRQLSAMTRYANYFSPVVRGQEHLPATGPAFLRVDVRQRIMICPLDRVPRHAQEALIGMERFAAHGLP